MSKASLCFQPTPLRSPELSWRLSGNEHCSWGRHRLGKRSQGCLPLGNGEPRWLGGRIVQGALKFKLFQQVSKEVKELRAKGKIADEFAEKK